MTNIKITYKILWVKLSLENLSLGIRAKTTFEKFILRPEWDAVILYRYSVRLKFSKEYVYLGGGDVWPPDKGSI